MGVVPPKNRDIRRWLREDGYVLLKKRATSHEQWVNPTKRGRVTVSGADGDEPHVGTWRSIRKQAHWDEEGTHDV